jgi:GTPase
MIAESPNGGEQFRCGYVAVIGEPNVGKSTLVNAIVGQKVTIVADKPQTTRHKILAILNSANLQAVFLDTPGILHAKYRLHSAMMDSAQAAIADADLCLLLVDAADPSTADGVQGNLAFEALRQTGKPVFLVINKIDIVKRDSLLPVIGRSSEQFPFKEIFPISALKGTGLDELVKAIAAELPFHPPYYPADIISEHPERFFVGELIREKIFLMFREEIPYSTTVDIIEFSEREGQKDLIRAEVYVERESQRRIIIGKKGEAMKEIGIAARRDIEEFLQRPVFLEIHVKVREKWREDEAWLRRLGYR